MSDYRTLNRTVLAKVEATPGTDAAPVVGTDAILVEDPSPTPNLQTLDTNEVTGSLDRRAPVVGGGGAGFSCTVNMRGSGAAGTAPEWGPLMQGCGFAETTTGADNTDTAQAGSTSSTIKLAVGDAGADDAYIGMIIDLTGGVGSGQTRVITDYVASTKVATIFPDWTTTPDITTVYAIRANQLYVPATTGNANLTIYDYQHSSSSGVDSRLRKVLGAMGNVNFTLPVRGLVQAAFEFSGKFVTPTDVAKPGAATFDVQRPVAFQSADISLDGTTTKFNQMTLDMGNEVSTADDPADTFGIDVAGIVRRSVNGRINPPLSLLSVRDVWADFLNATSRKLWIRYGAVNNGLSFYFPTIRYTGQADEDINGFAHEGIPFFAQGEDSGVYISVY